MAEITIYSTSTCVYCKMLKQYLDSKSVPHQDVLLDVHPEEMQASIDACGSMGVPCTHIVKEDGTEVNILGFDQAKIDEALDLA